MGKRDIASDFIHLSQALTLSEDSIPYELVVILENCLPCDEADKLKASSYQVAATANLIALSKTDDTIQAALKNIAENIIGQFDNIQAIAQHIYSSFLDTTYQHKKEYIQKEINSRPSPQTQITQQQKTLAVKSSYSKFLSESNKSTSTKLNQEPINPGPMIITRL